MSDGSPGAIVREYHNECTVVSYDKSVKEPLLFFARFYHEVVELVRGLARINPHPLTLFYESFMMKEMERSGCLVRLRMHVSSARSTLTVDPPVLEAPVIVLLRRLLRRFPVEYGMYGHFCLCFLSFREYPDRAASWPVLPLEWLTRPDMLLAAIASQKHHPSSFFAEDMVRSWSILVTYFDCQFSFDCDTHRSPRTLCQPHPDRTIPRRRHRLLPKSVLVRMAHHCGVPDATAAQSRKELCHRIAPFQPTIVAFDLFFRSFHTLLMESFQPDPRFFVTLKGGQNLNILLEYRFHETGRIFTDDLDFTISSWGAQWSMPKILQYWETRILQFIETDEYTKQSFVFHKTTIPQVGDGKDEGLHTIMMVKFQNRDFIDLSFLTTPLPVSHLNRTLSKRFRIPILKWSYAIRDLFELILRSNLYGISEITYQRRNPLTGTALREKGIRDLYRARTACEAIRKHPTVRFHDRKRLAQLCTVAARLTVPYLRRLSFLKRQAFFRHLATLFGLATPSETEDHP